MPMTEFTRLQLIISEDLTKSLIAFHTDLEASCEELMSDFAWTVNLYPIDPVSHQVKALTQKFWESTSVKMNLPLMELDSAREDMEGFLRSCLHEISSNQSPMSSFRTYLRSYQPMQAGYEKLFRPQNLVSQSCMGRSWWAWLWTSLWRLISSQAFWRA